jgi:hypothetical protein
VNSDPNVKKLKSSLPKLQNKRSTTSLLEHTNPIRYNSVQRSRPNDFDYGSQTSALLINNRSENLRENIRIQQAALSKKMLKERVAAENEQFKKALLSLPKRKSIFVRDKSTPDCIGG